MDSSLDNFQKIPAELREQIWKILILDKNIDILLACRQICKEAEVFIYKDSLTFQIIPVYKYKSWLKVSNRSGRKWYLRSPKHAVGSALDISAKYPSWYWHRIRSESLYLSE